jgi:hypothetical protein
MKLYWLPAMQVMYKIVLVLHIFTYLASIDTFVPTKIVLKVGFLERDFERDHLAEKSNRTKMGQKIHCALPVTGAFSMART